MREIFESHVCEIKEEYLEYIKSSSHLVTER